jgi:hypothetical protein
LNICSPPIIQFSSSLFRFFFRPSAAGGARRKRLLSYHHGSHQHLPPQVLQWPLLALSAFWHVFLQLSSEKHEPLKAPDGKSAATSSTTLTLAFKQTKKKNAN